MVNQFRHGRHSVTDIKIHLVCVTKCRRSVFTAEGLECVRESFESVAKKMDFSVLEFNGEADHIHALIEYPPKLSVSQVVNHLKGVSSRKYRKQGFRCPSDKALWSPSYFAVSAGGAPLKVLKQYIERQKRPS